MIKRRTAFILGAGASYPYGFPTGEGLVDEIIRLTQETPLNKTFFAYDCAPEEVHCFGHDLANSNASSVDSFLEHRRDFLKIGKLAIALALRPKERDQPLLRSYRRANHAYAKMTWYHYLWQQMSSAKGRLGENRVSFVSLNYDRSLERFLFLCLKAQHGYRDNDECLNELYGLQFVHVYGSLGDERFVEDPFDRIEPSPLEVKRAADRLRIIHEEATEAPYLAQAVDLLKEADVICFLGYGFHGLNNQRLGLSDRATEDRKTLRRQWFASRFGITDAEFSRVTNGFHDRFSNASHTRQYTGGEDDGALEVLRRLPVIG
jgi:hypothetical protein